MNLSELNDLRARVLRGEEVPAEELREALDALRAGRRAAALSTPAAKPTKEPPMAIDLAAIAAKIAAKRTT
jgi:hypothetical protein